MFDSDFDVNYIAWVKLVFYLPRRDRSEFVVAANGCVDQRMRRHTQTAISAGAIFLFLLGIGLGVYADYDVVQTEESSAPETGGAFHKGDLIVVPERSPLRAQIRVQAAAMLETPHTLLVPASVEAEPSRTANILPPVTGKVVELKVRLGDTVKKGQVLAVLASGDFAQAASDLSKARDALQLAQWERDRTRKVFAAGGGANKDVEQAESNYTQALKEEQRAVDRVKAIGGGASGDIHQLALTAPVSGSVTLLSVSPGAYINDATVPIMTISNLDSIWFTAYVPENSVAFVAKGQKVIITLPAYPGKAFNGTVAFTSAVLEPDTRSDKVRIAFDNRDGKFKPNMFANVRITIPQGRHISIPDSALLMNNDSTTVFVEVRPWTFVRRTVEIGDDEGANVGIVKGLHPGDRVIVKGGILLND